MITAASITDAQIVSLNAEPDQSTHGHLAHGWRSLADIIRDAIDASPGQNWRRMDARACCAGILNARARAAAAMKGAA